MTENFVRSKDPRLGPGSLWAAIPIPACRVLTYGGHVKAALVLYALVLHSSDRGPTVFPSRETIKKFSGVGKNSITGCIKTLEYFGFVKIQKIKTGRTYRNQYEILRASWHWDEFNEFASRFKIQKDIAQSADTGYMRNLGTKIVLMTASPSFKYACIRDVVVA